MNNRDAQNECIADNMTQRPSDRFTNDELIGWLLDLDDTVPRSIIDECAVRGEPMAQAVIALFNDEYDADVEERMLRPWPRFHAIMILGLSTSNLAGRALVSALKTIVVEQDDFLMGWLADHWPALFRNKSKTCVAELTKLIDNPKTDLYVRTAGVEILLSFAHRESSDAINQRLRWIASFAADGRECFEFRLVIAVHLLSFPRDEHRALVERFAGTEWMDGPMYRSQDIESAYAAMRDAPEWDRFADPWAFYSQEAFVERCERWDRESMKEMASEDGRPPAGTIK